MIIPPPSPVSEPSIPAQNEPPTTNRASVNVVMAGNLARSGSAHKVPGKRARHVAHISPLPGWGDLMETLIVQTTVKRTARRAAAGAALALTVFAACKKTGQANGDVTRNWTPSVQDTVMGVATSAVTSAIQQRLGSSAPDHVTADQWKH